MAGASDELGAGAEDSTHDEVHAVDHVEVHAEGEDDEDDDAWWLWP